jgi:4-hydroxy-tetrahydrodipicolinate reductase
VSFSDILERIKITHEAHSKNVFANGAIRGARWLLDRPPELYTMNDILADQIENVLSTILY